ncbi:hypothetical protein ASPWEDRAFT_643910 [Aspergillus wentii DTO 134E9]|uniref:FAD/NAD(P)-binding domain-containing protein n=1 Tax=Aspergillus wentii DTO 134E9 TaxID=1073089 RepID=A0A1L9RAS0_ASPWE|nr:uncharacterized protein ASPWEDRAFT_643910 [Aspergillus wentii DTO 134E9]KAI9934572.1 hypothetical protein MW887_000187 [Aspergillus wentii]OJJ31988.1 hypothetical protein ASPWEDRAFT_643910 [Aspergillus wentii DTO 134E9]
MFYKILLFLKIFKTALHQLYSRAQLKLTSLIHRLTYHPVSHPRNIVIIGASFAGYTAAHRLAHSIPTGYRVFVVEKNSHFQLSWVLPRFCTVGGHEYKAFIPYGPYLAGAPDGSYTWVRDCVEKILPDESGDGSGKVQLGTGDCVDYEYLVFATGSSAELPSRVGKEDKRDGIEAIQAEQERVKAAQDVVIVGGGPAGIEIAADAKSQYPGKNVTLVHSREALLNARFGDKLRENVLMALEGLGVVVVLGERMMSSNDEVILSSGRRIACDCLIKCTGQTPNSSLLSSFSPSSISPSGHIKVRPTLQLSDTRYSHIYAAGDVIDMGNINGYGAVQQAQIVAQNIVSAIKKQEQREYRPQWWEGISKLTLGMEKSVVYINDGSADVTLSVKNRAVELDSAMVWKYLGVKPYEV